MATVINPRWSKPSTILFATEIPASERAFEYCLSQAAESGADVILFHAYDTLVVASSETSGIRYYDYAAAARVELGQLEPLAERVRAAGLRCEVVVRPGLAADQILAYTRERDVDRIVMGTHAPGRIGKILIGSVAEAVLRSARVPVFVVGPQARPAGLAAAQELSTKLSPDQYPDQSPNASPDRPSGPPSDQASILAAVSLLDTSGPVVALAAEIAAQHGARLVLQHVLRPHETDRLLAERTLRGLEEELLALVPEELRGRVPVQAIVIPGDATLELAYQARTQAARLVVMGAQGATAFAALARHGVVYKLLAQAACPVLALPPALLAQCGATGQRASVAETFLAGVF